MKHFILVLAMLMTASFLLVSCNDTTGGNSTSNASNTADNANTSNSIVTKGEVWKNSIGMEFAKIPAGSFMMGLENGLSDETVHKVTISKDFYIGKYEVTQVQWKAIMGNNPSNFKGDSLPIENVSWDDAQKFIKKLNAKGEGTYRLPTEAEWEYACRAGTTDKYAGDLDSMAWYDENSGNKTHEVGTKQPNAWGLYDMHGNVYEWTADWYGEYSSESVTDPKGATSGLVHVTRGGDWGDPDLFQRSANRLLFIVSNRKPSLGFRVVRQ